MCTISIHDFFPVCTHLVLYKIIRDPNLCLFNIVYLEPLFFAHGRAALAPAKEVKIKNFYCQNLHVIIGTGRLVLLEKVDHVRLIPVEPGRVHSDRLHCLSHVPLTP